MLTESTAELLWFILGLVLMLAEFALPGFVIVFFGIGAWVTALCVFIGVAESINAQLFIFIAASVLSLVLFRKKGKKYFQGRVSGKVADVQALDDVRGERAVVIEDISPKSLTGKVDFRGTSWSAEADEPIARGTTVEVVERKNLRLKVKPIQ